MLPSAADLLSEATAATQTVQSGYVEMEIVTPLSGESTGALTFNIAGDFQIPDRSHITVTIGVIPIEMILIGLDTYIKNPLTRVWEDTAGSRLPFDVSSIASFSNVLSFGAFTTDFDPDVLDGFNLMGEEIVNGERTHYVRGTVGGQPLADLLDSPVPEGEMANVGFWIGVDDFRIRKVSIFPEGSGDMSTLIRVTATVSDYDKAVDIQAPV